MGKTSERDSQKTPKPEAEARRARLAAELRENLKRRKAQAKGRRSSAGQAADGDGDGRSSGA
ncbi:MAG: hypothetical protein ACTHJ3_12040 [Pararhizobium sp.]